MREAKGLDVRIKPLAARNNQGWLTRQDRCLARQCGLPRESGSLPGETTMVGWKDENLAARGNHPIQRHQKPLPREDGRLPRAAGRLPRQSTLVITRGKPLVSRGSIVDARGNQSCLTNQPWLWREASRSSREATFSLRAARPSE